MMEGGLMPNQYRRGTSGTPKAAKAGTGVRKVKAQGSFRAYRRGILAQNGGCRMESVGEEKDRLLS